MTSGSLLYKTYIQKREILSPTFNKLIEDIKIQDLPFWEKGGISGHFMAGVSGGSDSVYLFLFLFWLFKNHLSRESGYSFFVAHARHGIRANDKEDLEFVKSLCKGFKIQFISKNLDVPSKKMKGESLEMASRRLRYDFFSEQMAKKNLDYLVLAHHGDDHLETFLMRLGEGTGPEGLTGIKKYSERIWRPLLIFSKAEITGELKGIEFPWIEDESNKELKILRNRVRKITSELKQYFPRLIGNTRHLSDLLYEERNFFSKFTDKWIETNAFHDKRENSIHAPFHTWAKLDKIHCNNILKKISLMVNPIPINRNYYKKIREKTSHFLVKFPLAKNEDRELAQLDFLKSDHPAKPLRTYIVFQDKYRKVLLERYEMSKPVKANQNNKKIAVLSIYSQSRQTKSLGIIQLNQLKWQRKKGNSDNEIIFELDEPSELFISNKIKIKIIEAPKILNLRDFISGLSVQLTGGIKEAKDRNPESKAINENFIITDKKGKWLHKNISKIQKESLPGSLRTALPVLVYENEIIAILFNLLNGISRPIRYSPLIREKWSIELEIIFKDSS